MADKLKDPAQLGAPLDPPKLEKLADQAKAAADSTNDVQGFVRALEADRMVYRMTVLFLGWAIIGVVLGISLIKILGVYLGKGAGDYSIPESLVAIASTAVGALAGLLSPIANRGR
jgi:hypothetical protein